MEANEVVEIVESNGLAQFGDYIVSAKIASLLTDVFEIQNDYANCSEYQVDALLVAVENFVKASARAVVNEYERTIDGIQRKRQEMNRAEAIAFLLRTKPGKDLQSRSVKAEAIVKRMK